MIAFDATANGSNAPSSTTTITWAHTCTGTNGLIAVSVLNESATGTMSATYNGVAMTLATSSVVTGDFVYLFYLKAPATGAHNVVVTCSVAAHLSGVSISLTGVNQTTPLDTSHGTSGTIPASTTGTATANLTTVGTNTWRLDAIASSGSTGQTNTSGQTTQGVFNGNNDSGLMTTFGPIASAGINAATWSIQAFAGGCFYNIASASFTSDGIGGTNSNFFEFM